jgi:protein-tyrosine phosphatase
MVRAYQGKKILDESGIGQFMTNASPPRWINAPGITNVRDLGGWPLYGGRRIRQGLVYRGSEMNSHCSITDAGRKVLIEDLGIRTDVDLRGAGEDRMPVLDLGRVEYVNLPVAAYDLIASPEYSGRYRALFNLLSTRSMYPIFIHCWGGADRTGTVALLLGGLLGMRDEDLYTDYELTSLSIWGERLRHQEAFQDLLQTLALFAADGSSLQAQVEHYLRVIGVTDAEVARIREILVE